MQFDDILREIGEFGRYQRWMYLMVFLISIPAPMHQLAQVFLAGASDHWCDVAAWQDEDCGQWGYSPETCAEAKRNASSPVNGTEDALQCQKYAVVDDLTFKPGLDPMNYNDTTLIECNDGWVYDTSQYKSSVIQQFDLVCDDDNLDSLSQSLYFVGVLVGSVLFGILSDVIGRRYTLFLCIFLQLVFGVATAFSPSYWWFTSLRMLDGAATMGVFLLAFVLGNEFVGPNARTWVGMSIHIAFSIGYMLLACLAALIRDWWILQLTISLPSLLFFFFYPFLPESVRWLLCKGRADEAKVIIEKAARVNKKELPEPIFTEEELKELEAAQNTKQANFIDLFRTPNLRVRTINCMFNWFVNTLVYYGLSLSTSDLGTNDYLTFFISGAVEIPAVVACIFLMEVSWIGRKWTTCSFMLFGGVACLVTIVVPEGAGRTTVAMLGKFGIAGSFAVIYTYSAEILPTPVRSVGIGLCSMCARFASISAPFILLLNEVWGPLPVLIFGVSSIVAGMLVVLLPETRGAQLPQTIEEGEVFGTKKDKKSFDVETVSTPVEKQDNDQKYITEISEHVNPVFEDDVEFEDGKKI